MRLKVKKKLCVSSCYDLLFIYAVSRHKKMFGERLMGHLLSCIKASRCSVDSNSVNAMKVIRYITTKCAENSRLLISLDGHGAIADVLKDHSSPPIVRRCACGVLANLCTADHSMTDYFMVVIKHIYDFVWEHNEDVKVCYMGCLALFALVESSPDNRIALYWQAGEFLARRIKRIHCTDEVIFVLCSGILTMLGQINLFWNIHAGHGETMELMKSIFVVLNKPSAYNMKLVVYGLEVLKSLVISDDPDFYFGRLIFMHRKNWFDILKQFATRSECEESVRAIMEWAHETESKNEDKEQ